ncbi:MAG: hypothetical protein GX575_21140 [Candidatus Anammoximicrobium sp.]|nr:hypothetical protein [Candidatus Anammoximicrobium sp.]
MTISVLYLGDTSLPGAAAYLAGLIHHAGWSFDYLPSHVPADAALLDVPRSLVVLSDYPSARLSPPLQQRLVQAVEAGAGLLMLGGWESYHGCGGDWDQTAVAAALPVEISSADDRVNCDQPALVRRVLDHPAVQGLPWDARPPCIGGFNRIRPKPAAEVILETHRFRAMRSGENVRFELDDSDPLLVAGCFGRGRVAALATDVAPHWVGGLIDWGPGRVTSQAPGAEAIEVGDLYAKFFCQLMAWTANL